MKKKPTADRTVLAVNLQELMREREISELGLAKLSGVSQRKINDIVNQRASTTIDIVGRLASALEIESWVLLQPKDAAA